MGDGRVEGEDDGGLGDFDSFDEFAVPAADSPSCFFHLVRRFWNQIFTCKETKMSVLDTFS